jgi:hypothetical protein
MNRIRTALALAAAPTALLIGLAAPASAAPAAARAGCYTPAADQVLTAEEGTALFKACAAANTGVKAPKSWHWMGNYATVYTVTAAANGFGAGAGEFITYYLNGVYPAFMYY